MPIHKFPETQSVKKNTASISKTTIIMELKDRILDTAIRLFSMNGIKSVRMDDIAINCGISKRTLYEIFTDREDLIRQSIEYSYILFETRICELTKDAENILEECWIALNHNSEFKAFNAPIMQDILRFYPGMLNDFIDKYRGKILQANEDRFKKGIEQGLIMKTMNIEKLNAIITNHFYELQKDLSCNLMNKCTNNDPQALKFIVVIFLRGLATDKGRKYIDENLWAQVH